MLQQLHAFASVEVIVSKFYISIVFGAAKVMPKVKTNRVKYPEGWELIEPTLSELQAKMREGIVTSINKIYSSVCCFLCRQNDVHLLTSILWNFIVV